MDKRGGEVSLPGARFPVRILARKTAGVLQRKAGKLSLHSQWIGLILFCLVSIGCSLGVIVYSLRSHPSFLSISPIRVPVLLSPRLPGSKDSLITRAQYRRIQAFEAYLSRYKEPPAPDLFYDSLLRARPHLIDSLRTIDSLFLSQ